MRHRNEKLHFFTPQGPVCHDFRRAFRLYSSPLSLQQDGKIKTNPEDAAYGECVARIGDFVCRVDYLQAGHGLDGRENRAQTLRPSMSGLVLQLSDFPCRLSGPVELGPNFGTRLKLVCFERRFEKISNASFLVCPNLPKVSWQEKYQTAVTTKRNDG